MATGKQHARASLFAAIPTGITIGVATGDACAGIAATTGCLAGILLTPDLDQIGISKSEWALVRRLGPIGFLWMAFWALYARLLPHRHWLSHAPVIGTLGRLAYLAVPSVVLWLVLGCPGIHLPPWGPNALLGGIAGLIVSDTLHWFFDRCPL